MHRYTGTQRPLFGRIGHQKTLSGSARRRRGRPASWCVTAATGRGGQLVFRSLTRGGGYRTRGLGAEDDERGEALGVLGAWFGCVDRDVQVAALDGEHVAVQR